jgi:uncharacterized pyridoxamine 5'-phosphate oxidase family protein
MPNSCTTCGGKFGLVCQMILSFSGYIYFCSNRCKKTYRKEQEKRVRALKYQNWLKAETST